MGSLNVHATTSDSGLKVLCLSVKLYFFICRVVCSTYRAVTSEGLHAAGVVVLNAATRVSFQVSGFLDQVDDLFVLTHAGGELCP